MTITSLQFQVIFHHLFQQLVEGIGTQIVASGLYSIDFEQQGVLLYLHVKFWKEFQLCRVSQLRIGQTSPEIRLLSVLSLRYPAKTNSYADLGAP